MSRDELTPDQRAILERAERLGIATIGYTVRNARFDQLVARCEEAERRRAMALDPLSPDESHPGLGALMRHNEANKEPQRKFLGAFDGARTETKYRKTERPIPGDIRLQLATYREDSDGVTRGYCQEDQTYWDHVTPGPPAPDIVTPIDEYIMTHTGEPRGGIVKDVAFNRKSFGEGQPENPDQGMIYTGVDGITVTLEQDFRDEELQHFFSYAINATRGIDPRNPPEPVDWEEMMRGGLQTALKRINIAFAVYGASRTATHQIVRSTRANFHQQSQRAHYYGDRPSVRMPESWLGKEGVREVLPGYGGVTFKLEEEFKRLAEHSARVYREATDAGISYQDARFALLEGTTNFILCEYSLDEFINLYAYRGCSMFQWEIVYIVREMRRVLIEAHPWLEPYIKISCEKTAGATDIGGNVSDQPENAHTCTFQGWEEVEGQCDFPWARESNRSFRSERHSIKRSK